MNKLASKLKYEFEKVNVDTSIKKKNEYLTTLKQEMAFYKDDVNR